MNSVLKPFDHRLELGYAPLERLKRLGGSGRWLAALLGLTSRTPEADDAIKHRHQDSSLTSELTSPGDAICAWLWQTALIGASCAPRRSSCGRQGFRP